jgi:hypothetical protein
LDVFPGRLEGFPGRLEFSFKYWRLDGPKECWRVSLLCRRVPQEVWRAGLKCWSVFTGEWKVPKEGCRDFLAGCRVRGFPKRI